MPVKIVSEKCESRAFEPVREAGKQRNHGREELQACGTCVDSNAGECKNGYHPGRKTVHCPADNALGFEGGQYRDCSFKADACLNGELALADDGSRESFHGFGHSRYLERRSPHPEPGGDVHGL